MKQRSSEQRLALLELDHAWEKERQQYLIYHRIRGGYGVDPRGKEPQDRTQITWAAVVIYAALVIVPLFFTDYQFVSLFMLLVGTPLFGPLIVGGFSETTKAQEYAEAKAHFNERRARILEGE